MRIPILLVLALFGQDGISQTVDQQIAKKQQELIDLKKTEDSILDELESLQFSWI